MIEYRTGTGGAEANANGVNGLVTPFSVETTIGDMNQGGFREQIAPGAFKKTLAERDIVFLWNHDTSAPLARTSVSTGEGSLTLQEAPEGLRAEAEPVQTTYGADLMKLTRAKVVKGMSFGFEVLKDDWTDDAGRASNPQVGTHRTIREVRLHEVSAVTFPAYTSTTFNARDAVNAARGVQATRAAKASYADLDTCGECGAEHQYGKYCGDCGEPMGSPTQSSDYCTSCGQKMDDSTRAEHRCERRADVIDSDHSQGIASVDAAIDEALKLLDSCDRDSLPPEANQAIDLIHGASNDIDALMKNAGIPDPDEDNGNSYDGAGLTTPDDDARDAQLDAAIIKAIFII